MFQIGPRSRRRSFPGFRRLVGCVSAAGIVSLLLTSCGSGLTPEQEWEEKVLAAMETGYGEYFTGTPPAYVVVTYPRTVDALPDLKRKEVAILRSLLEENGIPYAMKSRSDALVTIEVQDDEGETHSYQCYDVPDDLISKVSGDVLLYVNLDVGQAVSTRRHPNAKPNSIRVVVWDDPVAVKSPHGS